MAVKVKSNNINNNNNNNNNNTNNNNTNNDNVTFIEPFLFMKNKIKSTLRMTCGKTRLLVFWVIRRVKIPLSLGTTGATALALKYACKE